MIATFGGLVLLAVLLTTISDRHLFPSDGWTILDLLIMLF